MAIIFGLEMLAYGIGSTLSAPFSGKDFINLGICFDMMTAISENLLLYPSKSILAHFYYYTEQTNRVIVGFRLMWSARFSYNV